MNATDIDLDNLRKLQKVDGELVRMEKELASLPQRQAILDTRQKLADIVAKKTQVQDMLDDAEEKFETLAVKDKNLTEKQREVEQKLQEVQGDYRSVTSYTKELNGIAKGREKLSVQLAAVEQEIEKINPVMKQIMTACNAYSAKEKELIASFQQQGGALQQRIAQAKQLRQQLVPQISADVVKAYEQKRNACGAVALAVLDNGSCSACRAKFDTGRLSTIKKEAPLASCPSCRRLLIVE